MVASSNNTDTHTLPDLCLTPGGHNVQWQMLQITELFYHAYIPLKHPRSKGKVCIYI